METIFINVTCSVTYEELKRFQIIYNIILLRLKIQNRQSSYPALHVIQVSIEKNAVS
jgi:hypothetical protein